MKVFFTIKKTPKAGADFYLAGVERIELPSKVLETPMLPLYHTPVDILIIAHVINWFNIFLEKMNSDVSSCILIKFLNKL